MTRRIGIAGISHETNTYADASTGRSDYGRFDVWRGDEITAFFAGTATEVGGMLDEIQSTNGQVVPIFLAQAEPGGTITAHAYERLRDEMLQRIEAALPLDALALVMHGAAVAEGVDDVEADLAWAVRKIVGDVCIVATLDLHGNVTQAMADALDAALGYRLYPHEDMDERGREAVRLVHRIRGEGLRPVIHVEYLPVLVPPATTDLPPASDVNQLCGEVEKRRGVIDCTFFHGFPYADVPFAGVSMMVTTHGDGELAHAFAREVGHWIWEHRDEFRVSDPSAEEAVTRALAAPSGPVVVNEPSDNTGGGAPGDGTHLLRALLDAGTDSTCFGIIFDPAAARQAQQAGVGETIELQLGGKHDGLHGQPLHVSAYVKAVSDGRFQLRKWAKGLRFDLGPMARLVIQNVDVLVGSKQSQVFDPEVFLLHGIEVSRYRIVGLKSAHHFRAGFRDIASEIITADTPGVVTKRIEVLDPKRNALPVWPLHDNATYPIP